MKLKSISGKEYDLNACKSFQLHRNDPRNYVETIVEQINTDMYRRFLPKRDDLVILDLGANVGLTALHMKDSARKVYAVEPTQSYYRILCDMIDTFSCQNITPINLAAGNTTGTRQFFTSQSNNTVNSLLSSESWHDGQVLTIECMTLPEIFKKYEIGHVDFAKIDIEGGEAEIVDFLPNLPIDKIYMECHDSIVCRPITDEIQAKLSRHFFVERVDGATLFATRKTLLSSLQRTSTHFKQRAKNGIKKLIRPQAQ